MKSLDLRHKSQSNLRVQVMLALTTGSLRLSREHCIHMDNRQERHRQLDYNQIVGLLNLKYSVMAKSYLRILGLRLPARPPALILNVVQ